MYKRKQKRSAGRPSHRKIRILDFLVASPIRDIDEIVTTLKIPQSTCYRILKQLRNEGLVMKVAKRSYAINVLDEDKYSKALGILMNEVADLEGTYVRGMLEEKRKWKQLKEKQEGLHMEIAKLIGPGYSKGKFTRHFESYSLDETIALAKSWRKYRKILTRFGRQQGKMEVKGGISKFPTSPFSLPPLEKPLLAICICENCRRVLLIRKGIPPGTVAKIYLESDVLSKWMCPSCLRRILETHRKKMGKTHTRARASEVIANH